MEETKTVEVNETEKKENFFMRTVRTVKTKVKNGAVKVCKAAGKNPDLVFGAAVFGGGLLIGGLRAILTGGSESYQSKCLVESDVSDQYYKTKHPLTNKEILELDDKLVDGMTTGEALDNMGLLRKERKRR